MRRPRFIAAQARHAKGLLGCLIASAMARETWVENRRAVEALGIRENDRVLDVGCGHGRSLAALAARAPKGHVTGLDPSTLMLDIAVRRNRDLVKARRVDVAIAGVEALPLPDGAFDRALCVHALYFWPSLGGSLKEIARILKPIGRLVLVFRSASDERAVAALPADIYRFPTQAEVVSTLTATGFDVDPIVSGDAAQNLRPVLVTANRTR